MSTNKIGLVRSSTAGLPGGALRFAIFIPLGIYVRLASNHWNVIKDHPELHDGIYSSAIAVGEKIAAKWGFFGFCWSFAAWLPAILFPAPISIIFGIVDAAIAGYIAYATHLLAGYSPTNNAACQGSGAHEFQLPPGANESFFEVAARLNATATDSFHMCASFALEWKYGIAISTIYGTIAFMNIVFCLWVCLHIYLEAQREKRSFWTALLHNALAAMKVLGVIIFAALYWVPRLLFRFLPIAVKSPVRFVRRYGVKAGQGLEEKSAMQLKTLTKTSSGKGDKGVYEGKGNGEPAKLAEFLGIYDMLILVVENLHYVDLINLGLVSRSVREAVLPSEAYAQRMVHFKLYTCHRKGKRACWSCKMQICSKCKYHRALKQTTPFFHLDTCRPYCTKCYYTTVRQPSRKPRVCKDAPPTDTPNFFQRWIHGQDYHANHQVSLPYIPRVVCRECNRLDDKGLLEKRLDRTKWELKGNERQEDLGMDKCMSCQVVLGKGPRWWVCKRCKMECKSMLHEAWGRGEDKGTGDAVVGELAV